MSVWLHLLLLPAITIPFSVATNLYPSTALSTPPPLDLKARQSVPGNCAQCCSLLGQAYPEKTSYPGDDEYAEEQVYWSQQQSQTSPVCRFTPTEADDVSHALDLITQTQCQFAVKSGGHVSFTGASNIEGGVTIDLGNLSSIVVSPDRKTTFVGSGNRWADVYQALDPQGLSVIGGRNGEIGVGGLTLGGGISFFSGSYGWACDNVNNYEVVLANGTIVNANTSSYPDLYFALRGGGNNFGIVTRFDLATFEHGLMWGGQTIYLPDANASIYQAMEDYTNNAPEDPRAAVIVAAAVLHGFMIFANSYEYMNATVNPPILENFTSIPNISDSTRITDLHNLTAELAATQPSGFRQMFTTITFKNNAKLMGDIFAIWVEEVTPLINTTQDFLPSCVYQAITLDIIDHFSQNGGNALGITPDDGPLIILNMDFQWNGTASDDAVLGAEFRIRDRAIELAKERGLFNRYIYQNYASYDQDVFSGYGEENKEKLIQIQEKYDPDGVFTNLEPGYFKVTKD